MGRTPQAGRLADPTGQSARPLRSAAVTAVVMLAALVVAVLAGLRRAPLLTLTAVALVGAAVAHGVVRAPSALADRAAHAHTAVSAWQGRQISRWVCQLRATQALKSGDETQLQAAVAACAKVR
jgi:hypothetical protein